MEGQQIQTPAKQFIQDDVELVRYMWQNISGTRQAKLVPREIYNLSAEDQCICLPLGCLYFPAYTDMIPESFGYPEPLKNIRLLPVKETYKRLPWTKN